MKEIKRYEAGVITDKCLLGEVYTKETYILESDHKAVVETMQKRIDELEAERDNDKQVVETYRNRLYKKGLPTTTLDNNKV